MNNTQNTRPILELINLHLKRGDKEILRGINLNIFENEIFSILGYNGAGKTTLANTIMGLADYIPNSGSIWFYGGDITDLKINERAKQKIGLAWQEPARFEGITTKEYLQISSKQIEVDPKYLEMFGLNPQYYLDRLLDDNLSGGERKRIELAALFATKPKLVILDEPDSGIDIEGVENLKYILSHIKDLNSTALIITHQKKIAELSDRIAILCDGIIEKVGPPKDTLDYYNVKCTNCKTNIRGYQIDR